MDRDTISRQDIIQRLEYVIAHGVPNERGVHAITAEAMLEAVKQLPSAQPEIIRCRNCKFASGDSRICMKFGHSPIGELDFCSFAERREVNYESN